MGLNANFALLNESNRSCFHIPEYINYYKRDLFSESYFLSNQNELNRLIYEAEAEFNHMISEEYMQEASLGSIGTTLVNGFKKFIDAIINKIVALGKLLISLKDKIINKIKEHKSSSSVIANSKKLESALDEYRGKHGKDYIVSNIITFEVTDALSNPKFPDIDRISSYIDSLFAETEKYINSVANNSEVNPDFDNIIKDIFNKAKPSIFGKYTFQSTIREFISDTFKEYQSYNYNDKILTKDLYTDAYAIFNDKRWTKNNLSDASLKLDQSVTTRIRKLESSLDTCLQKIKASNDEEFKAKCVNVMGSVQSAMRSIYDIIHYTTFIVEEKYRIQLRMVTDANLVMLAAEKLIASDGKLNEEYEAPDYSDLFAIQESYNKAVEIAYGYYYESLFNSNITKVLNENGDISKIIINEADGESGKNALMKWIENIFNSLAEAFNKFKNRVEELLIKTDKPFWDKYGEKILKMNPSDTKVSDWYKYDINILSGSSFVDFDINQDYMKSDEALQQKIVDTISSGKKLEDLGDGSFASKITRLYQGEYIEKDKGQAISSTGYNHGDASKFVQDMVTNGTNSNFIKSINSDYDKIKAAKDKAKNDYDNNVRALSNNQTEQKATETPKPNDGAPQNAAAIEEDIFKFNLAECLGLMDVHEASFDTGNNDAQYGEKGGITSGNKDLDAMIKRYINYNTIAVTSRMTNLLAAYKQYMGLFKFILNGKKTDNNQAQENTANNENKNTNE